MNLKNIILLGATAVIVAVAVGLVVGDVAFVLILTLVLLAVAGVGWLTNEYVWVRVAEMETAVTFNVETKAFMRFCPPGAIS